MPPLPATTPALSQRFQLQQPILKSARATNCILVSALRPCKHLFSFSSHKVFLRSKNSLVSFEKQSMHYTPPSLSCNRSRGKKKAKKPQSQSRQTKNLNSRLTPILSNGENICQQLKHETKEKENVVMKWESHQGPGQKARFCDKELVLRTGRNKGDIQVCSPRLHFKETTLEV